MICLRSRHSLNMLNGSIWKSVDQTWLFIQQIRLDPKARSRFMFKKKLTFSSPSPTLVHHYSTGVAPRIKFVDLSAQSSCQKVSSTPLFVTHASFWILQIGMSKLGFRIVEDIFFMDLLELAKVCLFFSFFGLCFF